MFSDRAGLRTCRQAGGDAGADVRTPFSEQAGQVHGMISTTSYPDVCFLSIYDVWPRVWWRCFFKTIVQRFVGGFSHAVLLPHLSILPCVAGA